MEHQVQALAANFEQWSASLREMNKFSNNSPVIFSIEPGRQVLPAPDPNIAETGTSSIGPLARRILLIDSAQGRNGVTVGEFLRQMESPSLDRLTTPAIVYAPPLPDGDNALLLDPSARPAQVVRLLGTATAVDACCESPSGSRR